MTRLVVSLLFVVFMTDAFAAQRGRDLGRGSESARLTVRIVMDNLRPAEGSIRVQVTNGVGMLVAETFADSSAEARFNLPVGSYRIRVTGLGYEEAVSDTFMIDAPSRSELQLVTVKRVETQKEGTSKMGPPISALALSVPENARSEFHKGMEKLQKNKYDDALKHFTRATQIYPRFAEAFDAMGVAVSARVPQDSKQYFSQALAADDQYWPAYTHLAKVNIRESDFVNAEKLLERSISLNPRSAEDLFLLSYAELQQNHPDEAIAHAAKAHGLPHEQFVLVHMIAGDAHARKGQTDAAIEQFLLYLKEAPSGPQAEEARRAIKTLEARAKQQ